MQAGLLGTVNPRENAVLAEWEMSGLDNVLRGGGSGGASLPFQEATSADCSLPNKRSTSLSKGPQSQQAIPQRN